MKRQFLRTITKGALLGTLAALACMASANAPEVEKTLTLQPDGASSGIFGHTGHGGVIHIGVEEGQTTLNFSLSGLTPSAVYGAWLLLDTGANPCGGANQPACLAPYISCAGGPACVAQDPGTKTTANVFPFTPAAADNAGFTAGNGLDPNGFVADADGNAEFTIKLNYDIFAPQVAPVVLRPGLTQNVAVADGSGTCSFLAAGALPSAVDSGYMRAFNTSTVANLPGTSPSYQVLDAPGKPRLIRANVRGIEIVEHFDGLTHGHRPGLHVGNPAFSSCGDFENRLNGNLADAIVKDDEDSKKE